MTKVKHILGGREYRGEWQEDRCELSMRYEGPEGTVEGTATVGDDGNLTAHVEGATSEIRLSVESPSEAMANLLCTDLFIAYRQKYEMLAKKDVCRLTSEWAEKNAD